VQNKFVLITCIAALGRHAFMENLWEKMFKPSLSTIIPDNNMYVQFLKHFIEYQKYALDHHSFNWPGSNTMEMKVKPIIITLVE
jgi:hypothetical protein